MIVFGLIVGLNFAISTLVLGEAQPVTSIELENQFLVPPTYVELSLAGQTVAWCIAAVNTKTNRIATGRTEATANRQCPSEIKDYFEGSSVEGEGWIKQGATAADKLFERTVIGGRTRALQKLPVGALL